MPTPKAHATPCPLGTNGYSTKNEASVQANAENIVPNKNTRYLQFKCFYLGRTYIRKSSKYHLMIGASRV